jgi:hypothetical protein
MIGVTGIRAVLGNNLRRVCAYLTAISAVCCAALLLQEPAHAGQGFTWTGEGNGTSWTDPCNWYEKGSCQQKYPGSDATDDTATIEGLPSGPSAVTLGENITLGSLNLGRGPTGAAVTGGGLTLGQGLNWSGGNLTTDVTMSPGSSGTIGGSDFKKLDGAIHNRGRLSLDSGTLSLANLTQINNSGTLSLAKGSQVQGLVCCLTPPEINNTGTVEVGSFLPVPGADTAMVDAVSFNATGGTIDVGGGVLELRWAPGEISAGTRFVGDGKFRVTNKAEMFLSGAFDVLPATEFELDSCSGTCNQASLTGTGTMDGDGKFLWKGGDVDGQLTLGEGIETQISGPASKDLDGRIKNLGRTMFSAGDAGGPPTGRLTFGQSAKFTNNRIFTAEGGVEMAGIAGCCSPPAANFDNAGVFTVAGPGVTTVRSMGFRAGGEVNVNEGTLDLTGGAATLPAAGSRITGAGSVTLTKGQTMAMNGAFGVGPEAKLEIGSCTADGCSTGRLQGTGTLGGGGGLKWVSGYVGTGNTGAADDLTIAQDSEISLNGPAPKQLLGKLTNQGAAFFLSKPAPEPATGPLVFSTNGRFVNAATLYAGDRAVFESGVGCCGDGSADFVNLGKLTMSKTAVPSTGSVVMESLIFENRGTVDLASGTLRLGRLGGYNQLSGSTRLGGGMLESSGQLVKLMGGNLVGTGTITANVQNLGGTIAPGAPDTAASTGIIKIGGNYTHSGAGSVLKVDLKGTTPGRQFDQLQVTGQAFVDWGTLDLDTARGFTPGKTAKLKVLAAGQRSGSGFTRLKDPGLPNSRQWYAIYNPSDVTLGVRRVR